MIEGRDSHLIFPGALIKFYLKANLNTAAKRRFKDLKRKIERSLLKKLKKILKKEIIQIQQGNIAL